MSQLKAQAQRVYSNINWNKSGAYVRANRINRAFQNSAKARGFGLSNG